MKAGEGYDNVRAIHGSDHRGGVTMTATSLCRELYNRMPEGNIAMLCMCSGYGGDYVRDDIHSVDDIRIHLENRTLGGAEIKLMCRRNGGAHMLGGIRNIIDCRDYLPETAEYLIDELRDCFDIIICDTGNDIDNGLALGALLRSGTRLMLLSQCESSIRAFEEKNWIYRRLGLEFDAMILNKYFSRDPYDTAYIGERTGRCREEILTLRMAGYCRQAEMDHMCLTEYRNDQYKSDIGELAELVMKNAGIECADRGRRKRSWIIGSAWLTE